MTQVLFAGKSSINRREFYTTEDMTTLAQGKTLSDIIRHIKREFPDAGYGEIASFLSPYHQSGKVRTQHVYNVLNTQLKGTKKSK